MSENSAIPHAEITCTICGTRFDPAEHIACAACPLRRGCQLVCCPQCGYEMVDPERSGLARLFKRWLAPKPQVIEESSPVTRSLER